MRVWASLALALLLAIIVAACAGHDWASPGDVLRAIAGDPSLGARLLERRAAGLGFDERHGARHLAAQISDKRRWPDFLARLEAVQPGARDDVIAGAASTFDFALDIYAGEPA